MRKMLACVSVLAGLCTAAPVLAQQKQPADMTGAYQFDAQAPRTIVVGENAQNKDPADPANHVTPPIVVPQGSNHAPADMYDGVSADLQAWIAEMYQAAQNDPMALEELKAIIPVKLLAHLESMLAAEGVEGGIAFSDSCAGATPVGEGTFAYDLAGATNDYPGTCGATGTAQDVWFLYTPSGNGTATVETCGLTSGDSVLEATVACCGPTIACNDDNCGLQSRIVFNVTAGVPVYIRIADFGGGSHAGSIAISLAGGAEPANNACASATPIRCDGVYAYNLGGATNDYAGTCGATGTAQDVWFSYTPAATGNATVETCGLTGGDSVLSAIDVCGGTTIVCVDDACGLQSSITWPVTGGTTYLIRIADFNGGTHAGSIRVTGPPLVPANNDCANAIALPGLSGSVNGTTIGATNDDASCFNTPDVWYTVRNPQCVAGTLDLNTCGSGYDTVLSVHDACGNAALACNDDCFLGGVSCQFTLQSCLSLPIPPNTTYLVRIAGFSGTGNFTLNYNISYAAPANNDCVNAVAVGAGVTPYSNVGSTTDGPSPCGGIGSDVWFIYQSSCTQTVTATTCSANRTYDTVLAVYDTSACPGALIGCNDDSPPSCTNPGVPFSGSTVTWNATCGATYLIQVAGFSGAQGCSDLTITETPIVPANDDCAAAVPVVAGTIPYTNCAATTDGPQPCGGIGSDVWFVYNHPGGNVATTITTCSPVRTYDTVIAVYAGSCAGAPVACNDDGPPFCSNPGVPFSGSTVTIQSCVAQTYLIQVGGFVGAQGCSELTITEAAAAPFNDNCAGATFIGDGVYPYGNVGATDDGPATCGGLGSDVWFLYQASCTGVATATTCSPNRTYDTVMAVYDSSACPGAEIGCNDDGPPFCANPNVPFSGSTVSWNATAGTLYLIRVGGFLGAQGCSDLTVSCSGNTCAGFLRGDSDGSLAVNNFDIDPFVLAISDPNTYIAAFCGGDPNCYVCRNDINGDNAVNNFDIDSFVNCLNNLPPSGQPCP